MQKILPGGIYRLSLSPALNEQGSTIDVVVLSGEGFHRGGATAWVAPLVGELESMGARARMKVESDSAAGWAILDALRALDLSARGAVLLGEVNSAWLSAARLRLIHLLSGD